MFARLMAVVIVLLLAAPAWAGFDEGKEHYRLGFFKGALREFYPLAEMGHVEAQVYLGWMYRKGHGVSKNLEEAAKWYRKAAEQGDVEAQRSLGDLRGEAVGISEAMKWSRKAAEQGDIRSQYDLGLMYEKGLGNPKDYVLAYKWYNVAATKLNSSPAVWSAVNRDKLAKRMTPAQIAEAQKLARAWWAAFEKRKPK